MKEHPILYNSDMVRAILAGRKTQTRRPVMRTVASPTRLRGNHVPPCPLGQPGDRLWVKETFYKYYPEEGWPSPKALYKADGLTLAKVDSEGKKQRWTPSIHMPRILSRITLEITDIRVERLRNMTSDDAIAEGAYEVSRVGDGPASATWAMGVSQEWRYDSPLQAFEALWNSIYARRGFGWDVNPWVWVIIFKRVEEVCPKN